MICAGLRAEHSPPQGRGIVTSGPWQRDGGGRQDVFGQASTACEIRRYSSAYGQLALNFTSLAFSPYGTRLVTGRQDGVVTLWDAQMSTGIK